MKNELILRHKFFQYLYKNESKLIYLGGFGAYRLLTEDSDIGDRISEIKNTLNHEYEFLTDFDLPFAQEFSFSDNFNVLMLTNDNKVALIDLDKENSFKIIANSVDELFGVHSELDYIISQGYDFQLITKVLKIRNIIAEDRILELNECEYYSISDYIKLVEDIFELNKNLKNKYSIQTQQISLEQDTRYQFDIIINEITFQFDFLRSDEPNTIDSDDGYLNSIFLTKVNNILNEIKTDYFLVVLYL